MVQSRHAQAQGIPSQLTERLHSCPSSGWLFHSLESDAGLVACSGQGWNDCWFEVMIPDNDLVGLHKNV